MLGKPKWYYVRDFILFFPMVISVSLVATVSYSLMARGRKIIDKAIFSLFFLVSTGSYFYLNKKWHDQHHTNNLESNVII